MGFAQYLQTMSKQDEYYTPKHAVEVLLPYVSKDKTIWCPFDTKSSQYVQVFTEGGYHVLNSHISEDNGDFFNYEPDTSYDVIISNPPYSLKDKVYERLFKLRKPWAMFVPMHGLFDSRFRYKIFKENGIQLLIPEGRTKFTTADGSIKKSPPFQTVYVCWELLPKTICFE